MTILQHPSARVHFDEQPELEAEAFKQAVAINAALDLIDRLITTFGTARVLRWVKNAAAARGETV